MRKYISGWVVLLAVILFSGCFTQKKAEKQLSHVQVSYPELLASACATLYPPNILPPEFHPGVPVTKSDTVYVAGKKIPCPPNGKDTIWNQCPPSREVHDTTVIHDTLRLPYENTAKIASMQAKFDAKSAELVDALKQNSIEVKSKSSWRNTCFLIGGVLGLGIFLKIKKFI